MTDYSATFGQPFTTHHNLTPEQTEPIIKILEIEAGENLESDHWHPEIAGKLQFAIHYLQSRSSK